MNEKVTSNAINETVDTKNCDCCNPKKDDTAKPPKKEGKITNIVNYKTLKINILKSCRSLKQTSAEFEVDYDKLCDLVEDIGLVPVYIGLESKRLTPEIVPFLGEYLDKSRLNWLTENKFATVIVFVNAENIDARAKELLDDIYADQMSDPDNDKVAKLGELIANYPCYFCTIISYQNNSLRSSYRVSYEITCRANKVIIKDPNYVYNRKDF